VRRLADWASYHVEWLIIALIIAMVASAFWVFAHDNENEARFMTECQQDGKKRYECEALYGAAHQSTPIPVVIPVPVSR